MPIDTSRIPALEQELVWAHQVKPGGQAPNEADIAAIEAELQLHRDAKTRQDAGQPEPDPVEEAQPEPEPEPEPEFEAAEDPEPEPETADATEPLEVR